MAAGAPTRRWERPGILGIRRSRARREARAAVPELRLRRVSCRGRSGRIPGARSGSHASFCGLTGLKATVGRVSTYGILPLSPTLDTPGPLARSVEDVALLYGVMHGPDPLDPHTLAVPAGELGERWRRSVRGLRLARMPGAERAAVSKDMLDAYEQSLEVLGGLGAEIADIELPFGFADAGAL